MSNKTFRAILFYVLLAICLSSTVVTILDLIGYGHVDKTFLRTMMGVLIVELVAAALAFRKQLTGEHFDEPPQIEGEWIYECLREDENYKHGVTCKIFITRAAFGWESVIKGERHWMAKRTDGTWVVEKLNAVAAWENTWGTFTGNDSLRYGYRVNVRGRWIDGYGSAVVDRDESDRPKTMRGNFYQLPPNDPFYGFQRYWREGFESYSVSVDKM